MTRNAARVLRAIAVSLAVFAATGAQASVNCPVPDGSLPSDPQLPMTVKALATHAPIKIVTIGLTTPRESKADNTQGIAFHLADDLRRKYPDQNISVVDKRMIGDSAAAMEHEFDLGRGGTAAVNMIIRDVLPENPTVVLWAVGTYSAVNGADSRELARVVAEALGVLRAAHVDVILIDMQYSPAAAMMVDFRPYLEALQVAAAEANAPLFGRFIAMQTWRDNETFDLDGIESTKDADTEAEIDSCLGMGLAQLIERAQTAHPVDSLKK